MTAFRWPFPPPSPLDPEPFERVGRRWRDWRDACVMACEAVFGREGLSIEYTVGWPCGTVEHPVRILADGERVLELWLEWKDYVGTPRWRATDATPRALARIMNDGGNHA